MSNTKDKYEGEFPKCKFAGDVEDDFCASCNGITMDIAGEIYPCTECQSYVPTEEKPVAKRPTIKKKTVPLADVAASPAVAADAAVDVVEPIPSTGKAKITSIKAESGMSLELKDRTGTTRWYKFMYSEERVLDADANVEDERKFLWATVHDQIDRQAEEVQNFLNI